MKKTQIKVLEVGSALYVVAHAAYRFKRGHRRPTMTYAGERDPRKALGLAKEVIALGTKTSLITKEDYRQLFNLLPVYSPTAKDMALMCPHLTPEEAVKAFRTGSGYVALPSLRIRHAFQIVNYYGGHTETKWNWEGNKKVVTGRKKHPDRLSYSYASRTPASYADGKSHGDVFSSYRHMHEAISYSEKHWGKDLILDTWEAAVNVILQDPSILVNDRYRRNQPKTTHVLYLALTKDVNGFNNDHSRPESEHYDEYIAEMTVDPVIAYELKGGRGGYTHYNCSYCGSGLHLSGCTGCGHTFRDDQFRCGWSTPLSFKQVTFLEENGHAFKKDPSIAWSQEKIDFRIALREAEEWRKKYKKAA